jgi:riboflavin kinase/FMN adenylyltransferase
MAELENGQRYPAVANVGFRPTVGSRRPTLEVHLLDFSGDLYGQRMTVFPCARLRGEVKFDDLEALKAQIERDQARARQYLTAAMAEQDGDHQNGADQNDVDLNDADLNDAFPLASAPLGRETMVSNTISSDPSSADDAADADNG